MNPLIWIGAAVISYLLGGINPAIIFSRLFYHEDIREKGSKNPGFTNFKRVYGNKLAWFVFILDLGKAILPMLVCRSLFGAQLGLPQLGAAYSGFFAFLGHVFPVWYRFTGGKGFLVCLSAMWCIDWRVGMIGTLVMLVLLLTTRYMSLAVILAMLCCPVALWLFGADHIATVVFCAVSVLLLIYRHKGNIKRLLTGTESKFSFHSQNAAPKTAKE